MLSSATLDNLGRLVLRLSIGVLLIMHGIAKLFNGVGGIEQMVIANGLPAFTAWGVYVGEVIAPIFIILGFYTRLGGLIAATNMFVAIALAYKAQIFLISGSGGWAIELQGLFLFGSVAIMLLGAGKYSVAGPGGKWN